MVLISPQSHHIILQLLPAFSHPRSWFLLLTRPVLSSMRVASRGGVRSASSTARRLTRLRNRRIEVDRRAIQRADFHVLDVLCEEFLPIGQGSEFLFGEAAKIVGEMCLKAACDEGSRCISASPKL